MFRPPRCPHVACPAHRHPTPRFCTAHGSYRPRCRPHPVPRFRCRLCHRTFSRQTFRADYRQKKPHLNAACLELMTACVGLRQAARVLRVARRTVERRFLWLGRHADDFLANRLRGARLTGPFHLDEMESFEANRYQPVTVPVLIDSRTLFLVGSDVGPLRRKGRMTPTQHRLRAAHERRHGRRPSHSAHTVRRVLAPLDRLSPPDRPLVLHSDHKSLYGRLGRRLFGARFAWQPHDASARRDRANPLFPINHTNARLRHFLARLRRRTWCVSKLRRCLRGHLRIAALWMNYCRGITNRTPVTPAQALGLAPRPLRPEEVLAWRQDWGSRSPSHSFLALTPPTRSSGIFLQFDSPAPRQLA
jgi:transposase-like protein